MTHRITVTALVGAVFLAGCGGHAAQRASPPKPRLPRALAAELASLSDTVAQQLAANDACDARATADELQTRALAAVAAGDVPPALRQQLTRATADIAAGIRCVTITVPPPDNEHRPGKDKRHGGEGG
jgi:hypothetical protein